MGRAGLEFPTGSNASPFSFFLARTAVSRSFFARFIGKGKRREAKTHWYSPPSKGGKRRRRFFWRPLEIKGGRVRPSRTHFSIQHHAVVGWREIRQFFPYCSVDPVQRPK